MLHTASYILVVADSVSYTIPLDSYFDMGKNGWNKRSKPPDQRSGSDSDSIPKKLLLKDDGSGKEQVDNDTPDMDVHSDPGNSTADDNDNSNDIHTDDNDNSTDIHTDDNGSTDANKGDTSSTDTNTDVLASTNADTVPDDPAAVDTHSKDTNETEHSSDNDNTPPPPPPAPTTAPATSSPVTPAPPTPTISYATAAAGTSPASSTTFHGKNTLTADISALTFKVDQFLQDLKQKLPLVLNGLKGVSTRGVGNKTLEVLFANESSKNRLLSVGLDTHGAHLTFIPEVPDSTTVTIFNLPMEMPDHLVDAAMGKYGTVQSRYRHKRNFEGLSLLTGLRVYRLQLKSYLPKNLTISGHAARTLYTGQREEMEKRRATRQHQQKDLEKSIEAETSAFKIKLHEVVDHEGVVQTSFVHPSRKTPPASNVTINTLKVHDRIKAQEKHFAIQEHDGEVDSEYVDERTKTIMGRRRLRLSDLFAVVLSSNSHRLPRGRFTEDFSLNHLKALAYWLQFGYASQVDLDKMDREVHSEDVLREWVVYERYSRDELIKYSDDFANGFDGCYICLPKEDV